MPWAKSAKTYSVAKDTRFKEYKKNLPSPADYNIPSRIQEGPKYNMGLKTFYDWKPLATHTGPGDYNPQKPNFSKSYTMRGKDKDARNERAPGPGSYEAENYYKKI